MKSASFIVILCEIYIYVMLLKQVDYDIECDQSNVDTLHVQEESILNCGDVKCTKETRMEQQDIKNFWIPGDFRVSCYVILFILAEEIIGDKSMFVKKSKLVRKTFDLKGKEPLTLVGKFSFMDNKNILEDWIKEDDIWTERLRNLEIYGDVDKITGDFLFKACKLCNGPWIAHSNIDEEEVCDRIKKRTEKLSDFEVISVQSWIKEMPLFWTRLAEIDTRQRASYCDSCNKSFPNRAKYESI